MIAKGFKKKNHHRWWRDRSCSCCAHCIVKQYMDGTEHRTTYMCSANGAGRKLFSTLPLNVCDSWEIRPKERKK